MIRNPSSNAGYVGSIPGQGTKIPHAAGQLSPRATTREEKTSTPQLERSPHAATKNLCAATKDPVCPNQDLTQPKINKTNK